MNKNISSCVKVKDLTGKKFGYWEVLSFSYVDKKSGNAYWACQCGLCGRVKDVRSDSLQSGGSTKCGKCAALERIYGII